MNPKSHATPFRYAQCLESGRPGRAPVEQFIREVYRARYAAEIDVLYPQLLAFRDEGGALAAAVGLRCGEQGGLFIERYLPDAAESVLGEALAAPVRRQDLIEFGNFAARNAGDSRTLVLSLIPLLRDAGKRWVLFVATRQLRNAFARLGLVLHTLGPAKAEALGADASRWGRYYDAAPIVCAGDLWQVSEGDARDRLPAVFGECPDWALEPA